MSVHLQIETWNEIFWFIPLPILGQRIAPISKFLNSISNIRILDPKSERTIEELAIFEEYFGIIEGTKFRKKPIPHTIPPKNVHINSIIVFWRIGSQATKFLHLLTSIQSCHLHFDGSHFSQQYGIWPNNVQKVSLAKSKDEFLPSNFRNGHSLFHIFTEQIRLLEITFIECELSEPDYNQNLFIWLNHPGTKSKIMILSGEEPNIQQFLRDARQNFSNAIEPANYKIKIKTEMCLKKWADKNWRTQEKLVCQRIRGDNNMNYCLERKSLERELIEFDKETKILGLAAEMKKQKEEGNEDENNLLQIFFK